MKNKLMKMQFLLLLTTVVVVQSFAQSNSIKINKEHPRLILSNADIDLMRGNALSGIEPWKTAWENLKNEIDGYADEKLVAARDNTVLFAEGRNGGKIM